MKIRQGFVSNSSSSSFVIRRDKLKEYQMPLIDYHIEISKALDRLKSEDNLYNADNEDRWEISYSNDYEIEFYTRMDNFDMYHYLTSFVGIDPDDITFK